MEIALLLYFLLFFAVAMAWPTWRIWQRDGINALVLPSDDTVHGLVGRWFKGLMLGVFAYVIAAAAGVDPVWFGPLNWADHFVLKAIGMLILVIAFGIIVFAHSQLGRAWRIGVDADVVPDLVTTGLFSWSRNPIFLGMRASIFGLFLMHPTGVSLTFLLLTEALIAFQVRLEETYLKGALGQAYEDYSKAVSRWI